MKTYRLTLSLSIALASSTAACIDKNGPPAGAETGACVDGVCLEGLQCLSDVCVDPDSTSDTEGSGSTTGTASSASSTGSTSTTTSTSTTGPQPTVPAVSVLFVVDNSGSMGEEQSNLSENLGTFVDALGDVDVRIAITTTDNGNSWCQGTTPEAGNFVLSSCRSRLQEFIFQGQTEIDATAACTNFCTETAHQALSATGTDYPTTPTTTAEDPTSRSRPWIERIDGNLNLPAGVGFTEGLQCLLPQGISGCGFEAPLENMYKAGTRIEQDGEDAFGFAFDGGLFVVVFITDEVDCSYTDESIFLPDGNKTFWSLPDEQTSPTSAVCWNAGVSCTGVSPYEECHAANKGPAGDEVGGDDAVLYPVQRYLDELGTRPTQVYGIVGVPMGYPSSVLVYQDSPGGTPNDPNFQVNFGIGPGCTSVVAEAVPPVRLREIVEDGSNGGALYSICDTDYGPALGSIAEGIVEALGG